MSIKHQLHRRYEDASLEYTGINRHASDTRIGLMDSTVPIEAMLEPTSNAPQSMRK
ncbi:MAG: hypothetical protein IJK36_01580 [Bacteroidales bacterium]|nr:hypothetical protein [Bacteroidales bacterium]MBR0538905.1 hypothetical protein [Bacteroidales bacterium]